MGQQVIATTNAANWSLVDPAGSTNNAALALTADSLSYPGNNIAGGVFTSQARHSLQMVMPLGKGNAGDVFTFQVEICRRVDAPNRQGVYQYITHTVCKCTATLGSQTGASAATINGKSVAPVIDSTWKYVASIAITNDTSLPPGVRISKSDGTLGQKAYITFDGLGADLIIVSGTTAGGNVTAFNFAFDGLNSG